MPTDPVSLASSLREFGVTTLLLSGLIVVWRMWVADAKAHREELKTLIASYHAMATELKVLAEKWLAALK